MSKPQIDAHVSFRIEEVRDALKRKRLWRVLLRTSAGLAALGLVFLGIHWLLLPTGMLRLSLVLAFWLAAMVLLWRWMMRPLRHPLTLEHAARYIDLHHPELQDRVTGMLDVVRKDRRLTWMEEDFLEEARGKVVRSPFGEKWSFVLPARGRSLSVALIAFSLLLWTSFPFIWQPWRGLNWGLGSGFSVEPGDVRVRIGDDQLVVFRSRQGSKPAVIRWRQDGRWQEEAMAAGETENIKYHQFSDIRQDLVYQVQQGGWRSTRYTIQTWVPPELMSIDLTYHYPEYLDLSPREVPNSGTITALEGSKIVLRAQVNKALAQAEMIFDSGRTLALERVSETLWEASLIAETDDIYRIELEDRNGDRSLYNPSYEITVQKDDAPRIKIGFPRRDMDVTSLDEFSFKFSVSDDFGLAQYGIRYEIAGREPVLLPLHGEQGAATNAEGNYQMYLEQMNLKPGDLLTWTVWARDRKPDREEFETMGAPYFLEVRPFKRTFRESISDQPGGGGPQGENPVEKQKKLLIATWNLRRDAPDMQDQKFEETRQILWEEQQLVKDQVTGGDAPDNPEVKVLLDRLESALNRAVDALGQARKSDHAESLSRATVAQQEAFQVMLALEPEESRIQRSNQGNASGGGAQDPEIDQLEIDRNRNFYEDERRTSEEQEAAKEALDKLSELAKRQEMINEEIAKLISELQEEDTPEARRRLERLQEELRKNMEKLDEMQQDIARMDPQQGKAAQEQLDQARERMNQSLESLSDQDLQEARAAGSEAVENLQRLERELEKGARQTAEERVEGLQESIAELQQRQKAIRERVAALQNEKDSPKLSANDPTHEGKAELRKEKEALAEHFSDMIEDAAELSELTQNAQELLSRELGDWLRETSKDGILEEIEETREMVQYGMWRDLSEREAGLQEKLDQMAERFESVAASLVNDELDAKERVLDQLREVIEESEAVGQDRTGEATRRFVEEDHKPWREKIEDSISLLSGYGEVPKELEAVRREIERFRQSYRKNAVVPEGSAVVEAVVKPLSRAADQIQLSLQALRKERSFILQDADAVPEQYRKSVSRYFETLSEAEVRQQ